MTLEQLLALRALLKELQLSWNNQGIYHLDLEFTVIHEFIDEKLKEILA